MIVLDAIKWKKASNLLEITCQGKTYQLSAELLRVYSPSAEVQGHGNPILQHGKKDIKIENIELTGQYAIKLTFSDQHHTGLYTWEYLYKLATEQKVLWQQYLEQLKQQNKSRDPNETIIQNIKYTK